MRQRGCGSRPCIYVLYCTYGKKHNPSIQIGPPVGESQPGRDRKGDRLSPKYAGWIPASAAAVAGGSATIGALASRPRDPVPRLRLAVGVSGR